MVFAVWSSSKNDLVLAVTIVHVALDIVTGSYQALTYKPVIVNSQLTFPGRQKTLFSANSCLAKLISSGNSGKCSSSITTCGCDTNNIIFLGMCVL